MLLQNDPQLQMPSHSNPLCFFLRSERKDNRKKDNESKISDTTEESSDLLYFASRNQNFLVSPFQLAGTIHWVKNKFRGMPRLYACIFHFCIFAVSSSHKRDALNAFQTRENKQQALDVLREHASKLNTTKSLVTKQEKTNTQPNNL